MGIKATLLRLWDSVHIDNSRKLTALMRNIGDVTRILDIGCESGKAITDRVREAKLTYSKLYGLDIDRASLKYAHHLGIQAIRVDASAGFPFRDEVFDIVIGNQIIEHFSDLDFFVKEVHRVLKSSGYAIISTPNLAAWPNIPSLLLGFQPLDSHISTELRIGNPLSPHYMERAKRFEHKKLLTFRSLRELFEIHDFNVERIIGAGYFPFPTKLGTMLSSIDPIHSGYLLLKARKKKL